jgi:hypothetical protein
MMHKGNAESSALVTTTIATIGITSDARNTQFFSDNVSETPYKKARRSKGDVPSWKSASGY